MGGGERKGEREGQGGREEGWQGGRVAGRKGGRRGGREERSFALRLVRAQSAGPIVLALFVQLV